MTQLPPVAGRIRSLSDLQPGDHVCVLFSSEPAQRAVVSRFLREGLERRQRVLCLAASRSSDEIAESLREHGVDPARAIEAGQFLVKRAADVYLAGGAFDPDAMIATLRAETARAVADGWDALRVTGEMSWALQGAPGSDRLMEYEAKLNGFFPGSRALALCQYDQRLFPADELLDVLRTHPVAVVDGGVHENFFFVEPAEYLGPDRASAILRSRLTALAERHDEQQRLRRSQRVVDALLESQVDAVMLVTTEGRGIAANQVLFDWLGLSRETFAGCDVYARLPPDVADRRRATMAQAVAGRQMVTFEDHRGGRDLQHTIWPVSGEGGEVDQLLVVARDVTERVRTARELEQHRERLAELVDARTAALLASNRQLEVEVAERVAVEARLRESEARFRSIADYTTDWEIWFDPDGRLVWTNPAVERHVGYTVGQCLAMTDFPLGIVHADDRDRVAAAYREGVAEATRGENLEFRCLHRSGAVVWLAVSWQPIRDARGAYLGQRVSARDITGVKAAERQRLDLERRTIEAQRLEGLERLAGGVAHDFNNLLTSALGNASLAFEVLPEGDPVRPLIREIEESCDRAAGLARQMLAFAGKSRFTLGPVDLNGLVRDMRTTLQSVVPARVELDLELAGDVPAVGADSGQLRQVLLNLVTNAGEAIDEAGGGGPATVRITTGVRPFGGEELVSLRPPATREPGPYVFVEVADTGCGMDAATIARVFDPFFSTRFIGRGLGLAAVLGIVRGHGGGIAVESAPGLGARFSVILPPWPDRAVSVVGGAAAGSADGWQAPATVLLVEANGDVRRVVEQMIMRLGFSVVAVARGAEAVRLCRDDASRFRCVLLEFGAAGGDGEEAYPAIRRVAPGVPIIVSSAFDDETAVRHAVGADLAGFARKPYRLPALAAVFRQVAGPRAAGG